MKILLTGATGYIGKRLLPVLLEQGHEVIACVRDRSRFDVKPSWNGKVTVFEVDFLTPPILENAPVDFDAAYYLIHSMAGSIGDFEEREAESARNFNAYLEQSKAKQVIYLTGVVNEESKLSKHLESRLQVEKILAGSSIPLTALRAGIVIGSGSASFEIIRDLVEKLPLMIAPKWLNSECQPIAVSNVLEFLTGVLGKAEYFNRSFDIGCGEALSYREMLLGFAEVRGLKRYIFTLPVMTPRLSSYWLYFITSTSYKLAVNLVNSMKVDLVCAENNLASDLGIKLVPYKESVRKAFSIIAQNAVISSWKDSYRSSLDSGSLKDYVEIPSHGCLTDIKTRVISKEEIEPVLENIWSIGGRRGWYYANFLWKLRGYLDKAFGGIGLRRGRTSPDRLFAGDALDFWRVLLADRESGRLLLFAEMKLPGEAWLEFRVEKKDENAVIYQIATFRPKGIWGRIYWFSVLPFHIFVFNGMINNIVRYRPPAA
ncbi:MAG: SDR family oxidoreductase [Acidobacteriota bacterium]|nr:SDR family oxidoreductase [Acidobacteriota bacterium]MDH3528951.1 SDR family oxidoreductase [Acidobacteriota bacterium]